MLLRESMLSASSAGYAAFLSLVGFPPASLEYMWSTYFWKDSNLTKPLILMVLEKAKNNRLDEQAFRDWKYGNRGVYKESLRICRNKMRNLIETDVREQQTLFSFLQYLTLCELQHIYSFYQRLDCTITSGLLAGVSLIFDTTFVPTGRRETFSHGCPPPLLVPDPGDELARDLWSPKHKNYGVKYGVWCSMDGAICGLFGPLPGGVDDNSIWKIYRLSNLLIPGEKVLGDSAFQGIGPEVVSPFKDTKDPAQLAFNAVVDSCRSLIENVNQRLKVFNIIHEWKGPDLLEHEIWFKLIANAVNCDFTALRPLRKR